MQKKSKTQLLNLLKQLVAQEIKIKYMGSVLGMFWLVLVPLFTLTLYSAVFGSFLKARWGAQTGDGISSFALVLFPGLLVFNYFSECLNRASSLVLINPNYVKKVVFPLPLLAVVPVLTGLLQFVVGLLVWCVISLFLGQSIPWRIVLVPVLMLPFIALIFGVTAALSAFGLYVRDLISLMPIVTQVMMFMSPVLYPIDNVPSNLRWLLLLNPLTFIVEEVRALLLTSADFPWQAWSVYTLVSAIVAALGLKVFRALRPGFADVI